MTGSRSCSRSTSSSKDPTSTRDQPSHHPTLHIKPPGVSISHRVSVAALNADATMVWRVTCNAGEGNHLSP